MTRLLSTFAVCLLLAVPVLAGNPQGEPAHPDIGTLDDILADFDNGTLDLDDLRSLGLSVFSTPFNTLDGFGYPAIYNDDVLQTWVGIGSQIDGLGHLGEAGLYYNCNKEEDFAAITGLKKLGVHDIPPLVGRGVIIDMAKHAGKPFLEAGDNFGSAEIQAAAKAQGVTIKEGDIVLFHTGWTENKLESDPKAWVSGEPGVNNDGMRWLTNQNLMAIGADTWGVEPVPAPKGDGVFYGHVMALQEKGIYLLETMNTGPVLREGVNEFMFVLGQARIRGTVQMIINPVAMF